MDAAALHEDCERLERLVVRDFKQDVKGHREKLAQGHRVKKMLDQLQRQSQRLVGASYHRLTVSTAVAFWAQSFASASASIQGMQFKRFQC